MDRKSLIARVNRHLKKTRESPYAFGRRVMSDQTWMWKMQNSTREPFKSTVSKILTAMRLDRARIAAKKKKRHAQKDG